MYIQLYCIPHVHVYAYTCTVYHMYILHCTVYHMYMYMYKLVVHAGLQ